MSLSGMQQLILAFQGHEVPVELLRRYRPGAVILYPENLQGSVKDLVQEMRHELPGLRVLIDQEGGAFRATLGDVGFDQHIQVF